MKRVLLASAALILPAHPVLAQELITSPTSPAAEMTLETGWSASSGDIQGTDVWGKRAWKLANVNKGDTLTYEITVEDYASGSLQLYGSGIKHGTVTGPLVPSPNGVDGEDTIPSNFPIENGTQTTTEPVVDVGGDFNGSFRLNCDMPFTINDDPLLLPDYPGSAHSHEVYGNTGFNARSSYVSLRTTGGSTCSDPAYPLYRTAFWHPSIFDGLGNIKKPDHNLVYYKQAPSTSALNGFPDATHIGIIVNYPNGLRWIQGYNMATGEHAPMTDAEGNGFNYQCYTGFGAISGSVAGTYGSFEALRLAGCPVGAFAHISMPGPQCWDGENLDSPDHRTHVSSVYDGAVAIPVGEGTGTWSRCPTTHPYMIPGFSVQILVKLDASFAAGKWRLASDEQMVEETDYGTTLHLDYWEAWDTTIRTRWYDNCLTEHRSCNRGELGDTTQMKNAGSGNDVSPGHTYAPRNRVGWSRPLTANGTFTGELQVIADGELGLYGVGGFTGKITSVSVVKTSGVDAPSPVTQPHTNMAGVLPIDFDLAALP
jgi:hypothetical protein